jgi:predicted RNA-binding protein with PIN domain
MSDTTNDPRAAVPDQLLTPLLEAAADTLRGLEGDDVPLALRHVRGFDRRGLMHGPGPRQLRRALEQDADFRARVLARFEVQPAVARVVDQWTHDDPWRLVQETTTRQERELLASMLWACAPPPGADFGLGLLVAMDALETRGRGEEKDSAARDRAHAELEEAYRRANESRQAAEGAATRAAQELRDERRARRTREENAESETQAAYRHAEAVETQLRQQEIALESERSNVAREQQRARAFEEDVRKARAEIADMTTQMQNTPSRLDSRDALELADISAAMQRLAAKLEGLRARVEVSSEAPPRLQRRLSPQKPLAKRAAPRIPQGVVAASPIGLETMLKTARVVLVIDGYNVTKRAWPDASAADQRERLGIAVTELHRRLRCQVCCVFDGDGTGPRGPIRRGGVRVVFSDANEEADEVILREVQALPKSVPVVVASSDAWIREHTEQEGAVVVPADALLAFLRPTR